MVVMMMMMMIMMMMMMMMIMIMIMMVVITKILRSQFRVSILITVKPPVSYHPILSSQSGRLRERKS